MLRTGDFKAGGEHSLLGSLLPWNLINVQYRLVGLVVKVSASRAEDPGFEFRLHLDFSGVKSYQ